MLEGHGDDLYRYGGRIRHNFSTNIVSNQDHSGLFEYLKSELQKIGNYPEPYPISLEAQLAESKGCHTENVTVTNGAEILMLFITSAVSCLSF